MSEPIYTFVQSADGIVRRLDEGWPFWWPTVAEGNYRDYTREHVIDIRSRIVAKWVAR